MAIGNWQFTLQAIDDRLHVAIILVMLAFPLWLIPHNSGAQQKEAKPNTENIAPQDEEYRKLDSSYYVGSETCKGCHEDLGPGFERGPHRKSTLPQRQGPQWQGCEACHGPGKEHAESGDPGNIIRLPSLSREGSSKRCLGCHQFNQEHANFLRSRHFKNNVGCVDCHSIHHPAAEQKLLKAAQPSLCFSCHSEIKLDSAKPFHNPMNRASAKCTYCHNPHNLGIDTPKSKPPFAALFLWRLGLINQQDGDAVADRINAATTGTGERTFVRRKLQRLAAFGNRADENVEDVFEHRHYSSNP